MNNKFYKHGLIFIVLVAIVIMMPQIIYASPDLSQGDVNTPSDWAKEYIDKAGKIGLIPENMKGEYKNNITREEFSEYAVELYETLIDKETEAPDDNPFTDTQNPKVLTANKLGIVQGTEDSVFNPDNTVTREEICVMLYRTLQAAEPEYNYSNAEKYIFTDQNEISPWAMEAVGYLYAIEVINGSDDNRINPKEDATREEAIAFIIRMYDKVLASQKTSQDILTASRGDINRQQNAVKLKLQDLISQEMGKPYQWGGTGPDGYDCSGLVYALFDKLDIQLPRTSRAQAGVGTYVAKEDLVYGDLVFFARDGKNINHAGIYVGNGEFVHSPQSGDVVKSSTLMSGYYARSYYTARRVLP